MKSLYESLLTGNVHKPRAKVQPSSKEELQQLISEYIEEIKPHPGEEVNLNWIDISDVDDLSELFMYTEYVPVIDTWKIDHVKDFRKMFYANKHIEHSPLPRLQKKLLIKGCYYQMFFWCEALQTPPELPATKLTTGCYCEMFMYCTALEVAPDLPATKLEPSCYNNMFMYCEKLERAPELPATRLAKDCYKGMFSWCKNLKTASKMPSSEHPDLKYADCMYLACPIKSNFDILYGSTLKHITV